MLYNLNLPKLQPAAKNIAFLDVVLHFTHFFARDILLELLSMCNFLCCFCVQADFSLLAACTSFFHFVSLSSSSYNFCTFAILIQSCSFKHLHYTNFIIFCENFRLTYDTSVTSAPHTLQRARYMTTMVTDWVSQPKYITTCLSPNKLIQVLHKLICPSLHSTVIRLHKPTEHL